jgi:hypothetical protein
MIVKKLYLFALSIATLVLLQGCCSCFLGSAPALLTIEEKNKVETLFKNEDFPLLVIGLEKETVTPNSPINNVYYSGLDSYDKKKLIKILNDTGLFKEVNFTKQLLNKPNLLIKKSGEPFLSGPNMIRYMMLIKSRKKDIVDLLGKEKINKINQRLKKTKK